MKILSILLYFALAIIAVICGNFATLKIINQQTPKD